MPQLYSGQRTNCPFLMVNHRRTVITGLAPQQLTVGVAEMNRSHKPDTLAMRATGTFGRLRCGHLCEMAAHQTGRCGLERKVPGAE